MPRTDCKPQVAFGFHRQLPVEAVFDAPEVSSDGGLLLLRETDDRLGLSRWFAACLPDARAAERVEHDRLEQVRQRVLQIAMGYEDCNDADTLRHDPMLKTACDRGSRSNGAKSVDLRRQGRRRGRRTAPRRATERSKRNFPYGLMCSNRAGERCATSSSLTV